MVGRGYESGGSGGKRNDAVLGFSDYSRYGPADIWKVKA